MLPTLDYAHHTSRLPFNWPRALKITLLLLFVAYLGLCLVAPSYSWRKSICTQCGMYETVHARQLPFTSINIPPSSPQSPTPLSQVLLKHRLRIGHQHQFQLAYCGDFDSFSRGCGSGPARDIDTIHTAGFIEGLITHRDTPSAL